MRVLHNATHRRRALIIAVTIVAIEALKRLGGGAIDDVSRSIAGRA